MSNGWGVILPGPGGSTNQNFNPSEVALIGVRLAPKDYPVEKHGRIRIRSEQAEWVEITPHKEYAVVIYAYAYEGNIYHFDKPKVMTVKEAGEPIPPDQVPPAFIRSLNVPVHNQRWGGLSRNDRNLRVWRVSKHTSIAEIIVKDGTVEALILEANLPGNRAINTYASTMQLAHQNNSLTS